MKKRLVILGSTGSIGLSTLDVISKNRDRIELLGISAHSNANLLLNQINQYKPKYAVLSNSSAFSGFKDRFSSSETSLLDPGNGISQLATHPEADIILNAIVGAAGLQASIEAAKAGKRLALANKESMVVGGELINQYAAESGAEIIPVDSEHSAIWQSLAAGQKKELQRILLTGSGGPFRDLPLEKFEGITKEQALAHPTWNMGPKITIDSATMMNKGLEVIEAVRLFNVPPDKIKVVIHPESIVHSLVEFVDSSIIGQMSRPDMKLPIAYALFFPERIPSGNGHINLADAGKLTFYEPDFVKFPLLQLSYKVARDSGTMPAVYNAANEVAVAAFLNDIIKFAKIPDIVINCVERHRKIKSPSIDEILNADRWGRETAMELVG